MRTTQTNKQEVICKSAGGYSVGQVLLHLQASQSGRPERVQLGRLALGLDVDVDPVLCWTLALVCSVCGWALSAHLYGFQMTRLGLRVRVGCSYLMYRKALRLSLEQSGAKTMGRMASTTRCARRTYRAT